jgi:hypothetical protein
MKSSKVLSVLMLCCMLGTVLVEDSLAAQSSQQLPGATLKSPQRPGEGMGEAYEYLLTCKGGTRLAVSKAGILIRFLKASHGATEGELAPGECAWLNRGLYAEEAPRSEIIISSDALKDVYEIESSLENSWKWEVSYHSGPISEWLNRVKYGTKFHVWVYIRPGSFLVFKRMGP